MSKYWMHRIKHEWEVSYALLKKGYLSLGWSKVSGQDIIDSIENDSFNRFCETADIAQHRSRWNIWYFAHFKAGDIVVVPQFGGMFEIFEVIECMKPVGQLEFTEFIDEVGIQITLKNNLLYADKELVDIGFICKVKPIGESVPRANFADAALTSRMKMRQTNGEITDISPSVDKAINAIKANKPVNFYEEVKDELAQVFLSKIKRDLTPDKVEVLVKLYFEKMGATNVYIPSKNESGKSDGADADVVAEFEPLKTVFYIQVKDHEGTTSDWAVEQIEKYADQMGNAEDDYTYIPWVVSMADNFSEEAQNRVKEAASKKNLFIRLVNGIEFSKMLLDSGLTKLDKIS
ncbi:MAG: restriction endonuclease [Lachnospiraceae bacterium]|nr:restriction endonuclease [Lachnospiraceae bacterium]